MPKFFMLGIVLSLLLAAAGYGLTTIQARSIPWDCSDWQAFAHADRTTSILESLAENRGKTLYCGVDQSDTFTKAETWEAGRDRNERDDTVYFGERGQFRGFIAAQEGYLTDGESGVTGVSIDRILSSPGRNGGALSASSASTSRPRAIAWISIRRIRANIRPAPWLALLGPAPPAAAPGRRRGRVARPGTFKSTVWMASAGTAVLTGVSPGRLSPRRNTGRIWRKPRPRTLAGTKAIRR